MDQQVGLFAQIEAKVGAVILINTFTVKPEAADDLLNAWAEDTAYMKQQSGFISTQLHRRIAGSSVFVNYAVWESTRALQASIQQP